MVLWAFSVGCAPDWKLADQDGDGDTGAGDCWDSAFSPPGYEATGLTGADIFPGASETWYDGIDQDCDGSSDFDADGDGYIGFEWLVDGAMPETFGVPPSPDVKAGDCWDDPGDIPDGFVVLTGTDVAGGVLEWAQPTADQVNPEASDFFYDGVDQDCASIGQGTAGDAWEQILADEFDQDGDGFLSADYPHWSGPEAVEVQWGDDCIDDPTTNASLDVTFPNPAGTDASQVNPAEEEIFYDGTEQDCGAAADQPGGLLMDDCDQDHDAHAYPGSEFCLESMDCDDLDPAKFYDPTIPETWYNGVDENCDLNDGDQDGDTFWIDGYEERVLDGGGVPLPIPAGQQGGDCWDDPEETGHEALNGRDDLAPQEVFPGCLTDTWYDGIDQDCDGASDFDADGDTYASATWPQRDGSLGIDCYDSETDDFLDASGDTPGNVNPGATEFWYDGTDEDCDGNDGDYDGDGYYVSTYGFGVPAAFGAGDCDDSRATVNPDPATLETCSTSYDDDCDGNDNDDDATGCTDYYTDVDRDNYGASGSVPRCLCEEEGTYNELDDDDCDDGRAETNPVALDYCEGEDSDCDGVVDEDDSVDAPTWYRDADGDDYGDLYTTYRTCYLPDGWVADRTDCDDTTAVRAPDNPEVCDDGDVDEDCDGLSDNDDSSTPDADKLTYYPDTDSDLFGDSYFPGSRYCPDDQPSGWLLDNTDCDDGRAASNPDATDYCEGYDSDCDGVVDEDDSAGVPTWYLDGDTDGYGDPAEPRVTCYKPSDHVADNTDCDDSTSLRNPGNTEVCDTAHAVDEDCDGLVDDSDGTTATSSKTTFYQDADGDAYGDSRYTRVQCATPGGYVTDATDCDDSRSYVNPAASETCDYDDRDEDCDTLGDDDDTGGALGKSTFYRDADGDEYGNAYSTTLACDLSSFPGYVSNDDDCDDTNAARNPGETEICDYYNTDEDCDIVADDADSSVLESTKSTFYRDADSDTYGTSSTTSKKCDVPSGYVANSSDCNDSSATISPAGTEVCDSSNTDEDCDGYADDSDTGGATGKTTWYRDADGDTYGTTSTTRSACDVSSGYVAISGDCNDSDYSIKPTAQEICDASDVDEDCDSSADDLDASVLASTKTSFYRDADSDGYGAGTASVLCNQPSGWVTSSTDCNDGTSSISPAATEKCDASNTDEDCDGLADDLDTGATGKTTWYRDYDGDTYGNVASTTTACDLPTGYVADKTDCDDTSSSIKPGGTEVCDAYDTDEDCDTKADDADTGGATGKSTFYRDADSDGYGVSTTTTSACDKPSGYSTYSTDCDDTTSARSPGNSEVCDSSNVDEDCDLLADDADTGGASGRTTWYRDVDGDGYGVSTTTTSTCDMPSGYSSYSTDCDDTTTARSPANTEVCDASNVDEDCDLLADDLDSGATGKSTFYLDSDGDGYGVTTTTSSKCDKPSGYSSYSTDCDDTSSSIKPGGTEVCDSSNKDEDCDGSADDSDSGGATGKTTWYKDADSDGYGATTPTSSACDQPSTYVANDDDCDDTTSTRSPALSEVCDASNVDEDCDLLADDSDTGGATGKSTFYRDVDGDTYGVSTTTTSKCDKPSGYSTYSTDCDDTAVTGATIYPGATETCNSKDDDCDGTVDDGVTTTYYLDADGDNYGLSTSTLAACSKPSGYATTSTDCDDGDATVNPAGIETADEVDEDCDKMVDEGLRVAGELVISEIEYYSTSAGRKWFEVYNPGDHDIYPDGMLVTATNGTSTQSFYFGVDGGAVPAGGYFVFCWDFDAVETSGGTTLCDYEYGSSVMGLTGYGATYNGSFDLYYTPLPATLTLSLAGTTLDAVAYSMTSPWPTISAYNYGIELSVTHLDATSNDTGSNWCVASSSDKVYNGGVWHSVGTPGAESTHCP